MISDIQFPALYDAADELSNYSQKNYLGSLKAEYLTLITCAAMSINQNSSSYYYHFYAFLFILALAVFAWRCHATPEKDWYQGRALAESVKTNSWRFCMRAAPFDDQQESRAVADFQSQLKKILEANQFAGKKLPSKFSSHDQLTPSMLLARKSSLEDRMAYYRTERIDNQRQWYAKKAGMNKTNSTRWVMFCIFIYACAIFLALFKAENPMVNPVPTEFFITIASSVVGWIQIKKFNELTASYLLTAHEIGIMVGSFSLISTEDKFQEFVNDAEQAFSREHTQWVARST